MTMQIKVELEEDEIAERDPGTRDTVRAVAFVEKVERPARKRKGGAS